LNQDEVKEAQPIKRDEPKMGRNELVTITDGQETKEVKYKKAIALIESGEWRII
jgi:preprotein translocase subunit SecA